MLSNSQVVQRFLNKKSGHSRNMSTNGTDIFSYSMKIGRWVNDFVEILYNPTVSNSTSKHQNELFYAIRPNTSIKTRNVRCVTHGYGYNQYQFPKENDLYQVKIMNTKKLEKIRDYIDSYFDYNSEHKYGFQYFDVVRNFSEIYPSEGITVTIDLGYDLFAYFNYTSDNSHPSPTKRDFFCDCENCAGSGIVLTKFNNTRKCKVCKGEGIKFDDNIERF